MSGGFFMFKYINFKKMQTIKNIEFPSTVSVLGKAQTSLAFSLNEIVEYSSTLFSVSSVVACCCMSMYMCVPRRLVVWNRKKANCRYMKTPPIQPSMEFFDFRRYEKK